MSFRNRLACAAFAVVASVSGSAAWAGAQDYEFQPVSQAVRTGNVTLAVRLVHKPTGRPVTDAVFLRTRVDMSPEGMAAMAVPATAAPSSQPGVYGFQTNLSMAGGWALKLMAKVQGEADTIEGTVVFTAK